MKLEHPYDPTKNAYSFDLNEDMLNILSREFEPRIAVSQLAEQLKKAEDVNSVAKEIFEAFGKRLANRSIELGEQYSDRTWEMLQIANEEAAGSLKWPLFPQRFIELAYLGFQPQLNSLPVVENNLWRFAFSLNRCAMYDALGEMCPEQLGLIPCKNACLTLCRTIFRSFEFNVTVEASKSMFENNRCQFLVQKA